MSMYQLDSVGRLLPTHKHLSRVAAERHAQLSAVRESRSTSSPARPRRLWWPWARLVAAAK
jgi:hypothetical protein